MQFGLIDKTMMKIEHDGKETITASIREFSKTRFIKAEDDSDVITDPFSLINEFIRAKVSYDDQTRIYNAYKVIFDEFSNGVFDPDVVKRVANEQFKIIYDIIHVQDIEDYMERNNLYKMPTGINKDYTGEYPEERTYIESKFKGLIALGMAARMAIPVWGEFSPIRKNSVGSKRIPIMLIQMLNDTSILDSEQFKTLESYSGATVGAGKFDPGLVVAGFGTEYNKDLNLASNFVKKVAITPNSTNNPLAQDIYNFIANNGAYNDASTGDIVWSKKDPNLEEEKSKWEKYNLREQISQGDICMIEHYLSDSSRIVKELLFDIDPDVMNKLIKESESLAEHLDSVYFTPTPENLRIAQWLLSGVVPPKTLMYVGYFFQRRALTASIAILKYLGYPTLAALLVSEIATSQDGFLVSFKVTRKQMPEDLERKLDFYYPLYRKTKDREGGNMAKQAINRFYTEVNNSVMKVVADQDFVNYLIVNKVLNKHHRFSVSADTPNELARLLVDIQTYQEKSQQHRKQ